MMRTWEKLVGSAAILAVSFVGTLFLLDHFWPDFGAGARRDSDRAKHAAVLMDALARYKADKGSYPVLPDNDVKDLKPFLVDTGYLKSIPADPRQGTVTRYTSRVTSYGLLFAYERAGKNKVCIVGVGHKNSGMWGNQPECPF